MPELGYDHQRVLRSEIPTQSIESAFKALEVIPRDCQFIFGSVGRALSIASDGGLTGAQAKFRISPDTGVLDIDIAVREGAIGWTDLTTICKKVFAESGGQITIDPHLYKLSEGKIVFHRSYGEFAVPIGMLQNKEVMYRGAKTFPLESPGQLLIMAIWKRFRKKDIEEYAKLLKPILENKQLISDPRVQMAKGIIEEYLRSDKSKIIYDIARLLYHVVIPQNVREKLEIRKHVGVVDHENDLPTYGHESATPIYI